MSDGLCFEDGYEQGRDPYKAQEQLFNTTQVRVTL